MTHFKNWKGWHFRQVIIPMLPLPFGAWLLYKALSSYNMSPPPIASKASKVLKGPLYAEPVYQRIDFSPATIRSNATPRYR